MPKVINIPVKELMSRDLVIVKPKDTLKEVDRLFMAYNIHHLPVVGEEGKLLGLLSKNDLYRVRGNAKDDTEVGTMMSKSLATAAPDTPLREVAEVFLSNIMHAMPIVDRGELIGLVTAQDVLRYCIEEQKLLEE